MDERLIAVDFYNLTLTGRVCMTISGAASDSHHIPCVITEREPIAFTTEMTPKVDGGGIAFSLRSRDYKDAQCIAVQINGNYRAKRDCSEPNCREN